MYFCNNNDDDNNDNNIASCCEYTIVNSEWFSRSANAKHLLIYSEVVITHQWRRRMGIGVKPQLT